MKNSKIIGSAVLMFGLLATGSSFAEETTTTATSPAQVQERTREQNREKQENQAQHRYESTAQEGKGDQVKQQEMKRERIGSSEMRGNGASRAR